MTLRNVHAYTETNRPEYPAYVSLNHDPERGYLLTVRQRGMGGSCSATMDVPADQLQAMRDSLTAELARLEAAACES